MELESGAVPQMKIYDHETAKERLHAEVDTTVKMLTRVNDSGRVGVPVVAIGDA